MRNISIAGLAFVLALYSLNAQAQETPQIDFDEIQKKFDEITNQEFQKIDTNADGDISLEEYQDYIVKQTLATSEQSFAQFDKDGDKKISKQEYNAFMNGFTAKIQDAIKKQQAESK